jgi:hypothetical protein
MAHGKGLQWNIISVGTHGFSNRTAGLGTTGYNFTLVMRLAYAVERADLIHYANDVSGMTAFQRQGDTFLLRVGKEIFISALKFLLLAWRLYLDSPPPTFPKQVTAHIHSNGLFAPPFYRWRAALNSNFTTVCDGGWRGGWTDQYFIPLYIVR